MKSSNTGNAMIVVTMMFEDALVSNPSYAFLWPISLQRFGIGVFNYTIDWYGMADRDVLLVGLLLLLSAAVLRIAYEGTGWMRRSI
jgi:hypothetical protein